MRGLAQSSIYYRPLLCATVGSPGSGEDLSNINTAPLPDGCECFVTQNRRAYRLRKFSVAEENGVTIIEPNAGGGRWIAEGVPVGALGAWVVATAANSTDSSASTNWLQPQTNNFSLERGGPAWTFTESGCILTYHGPPSLYLLRLTATLNWSASASIFMAVSHNNDLTATEAGFIDGAEFFEFNDGESDDRAFSCERVQPASEGVTFRPKFRATTTDQDLVIQRLTLSAVPFIT